VCDPSPNWRGFELHFLNMCRTSFSEYVAPRDMMITPPSTLGSDTTALPLVPLLCRVLVRSLEVHPFEAV
jgi:hypothetical protein